MVYLYIDMQCPLLALGHVYIGMVSGHGLMANFHYVDQIWFRELVFVICNEEFYLSEVFHVSGIGACFFSSLE